MPGKHAKLSPSASERWISCPASIRMQSLVPAEESSVYAAEGTAAHALGELKASREFGHITERQFVLGRARWMSTYKQFTSSEETVLEMEMHTDAYVELLKDRMSLYPNSSIMLEQRLNTGVPTCWGTTDAVIVSPQHVEAIDFKYGAGVAVEARGNPQLRLYAVGALDEYGDIVGDTELVRITVHQPRMDHILTDEMTPAALRAWRDSLIPIAELALSDDAPFGPSQEACRWCPASGRCQAELKAVFEQDFEVKPDTLSTAEMSETLNRLPLIKQWISAFELAALHTAYSEQLNIPGYKVVRSGGRRSIGDQEAAIAALRELGYEEDEVSRRSAKTLGDLEKLLGKAQMEEVLKPFFVKSEGKESLVLESDSRPSITPNNEAAAEFAREDLL